MLNIQWALNSPSPMQSGDVAPTMEAQMAHWERVLDLRLLRNKVAQQEAIAAGRSAEPEQDSPTTRNESHAAVVSQMRAGIKAAAGLAADMCRAPEDRFHVTICGHVGLDYFGGVEERMQVFVDVATRPRGGWPEDAAS